MKTIFLAAGKSSRMEPLSDKNFLEFCGEPFLIKLLKNAQEGGLKNFIVVANKENKEKIASTLQKFNFHADIVLQENQEEGMAGGVLAGLKKCDSEEEVVLLGGNDAIEISAYETLLKTGRQVDGSLLAKTVDQYFPGGYLQVSGKKIISIVEKPGKGKEPSNLVNIVAHYFKQSKEITRLLKAVDRTQSGDAYEQALRQLFKTQNFHAVEYMGEWHAIKFPHHVLEMQEYWLSQLPKKNKIHSSVQLSDTARIHGEQVYIEEGVRIFDNAVICGPCFIGKRSTIGNNALVRSSNIGEENEVGFCSEIARSFTSKTVSVHHAYIGDSIIDQNVNFGAFSCTANLRLDKKNVKYSIKEDRIDSGREKLGAIIGAGTQIGIHAMLMPGCKVDANSFVSPGSVQK
jgi:bifunctional UDP-N-acetylglucosamine pyrophosphorylase/glucosamine-1-phosphate N-acetyltransferase